MWKEGVVVPIVKKGKVKEVKEKSRRKEENSTKDRV